jgi:hypothetical protein
VYTIMERDTSTSELPRIPTEDLASWVFNGPQYDQKKPVRIICQPFPIIYRQAICLRRQIANDDTAQILIDPANPSRSVSFNQAREIVGKLATGLRRAGLKIGDCVLVNSGNDVRKPQVRVGLNNTGLKRVYVRSTTQFFYSVSLQQVAYSQAQILVTNT